MSAYNFTNVILLYSYRTANSAENKLSKNSNCRPLSMVKNMDDEPGTETHYCIHKDFTRCCGKTEKSSPKGKSVVEN